MKDFAARLSDSQFLIELKSLDDKELLARIQDIEDIAHSLLTSLIDKTVESMAHTMAATQQENCRSAIREELGIEEMKLRNEVLVGFIRDLNAQSVGRKDS